MYLSGIGKVSELFYIIDDTTKEAFNNKNTVNQWLAFKEDRIKSKPFDLEDLIILNRIIKNGWNHSRNSNYRPSNRFLEILKNAIEQELTKCI